MSCTRCKKRPRRPNVSLGEMIAKQHLCVECHAEWLAAIDSRAIEQTAQRQFDKIVRDMKSGMGPRDAWDRKDETDA